MDKQFDHHSLNRPSIVRSLVVNEFKPKEYLPSWQKPPRFSSWSKIHCFSWRSYKYLSFSKESPANGEKTTPPLLFWLCWLKVNVSKGSKFEVVSAVGRRFAARIDDIINKNNMWTVYLKYINKTKSLAMMCVAVRSRILKLTVQSWGISWGLLPLE